MTRLEPPRGEMRLWGGVECTVNRVGDRYIDQLTLSGHASRLDDIDRIADLGIRTLRYPILWERTAPMSSGDLRWQWADERMQRMRDRDITPIVGLVHHGSGPHYTSLLDRDFAEGLAGYARAVAERYPWIRYVTPVNEPLTTARFSGLYGHWYPHRTDAASFAGMLLNQCVAIRDAMTAMRDVIPDLELVQTEDLGRVHSTDALAYQARFENERRWLTFDLLSGRVDDTHPMWPHLAHKREIIESLESLLADPCPPDIIGLNYYVTSERFLDDRVSHYDARAVGGNGRHRYADVEAARVLSTGIAGHSAILREAWQRYGIPLALTEVHLGCTREHQIRWLMEAWKGACEARDAGCDVRGVTAWALFGSFGWDTLVTRPPFEYESGAFDVQSAGRPRETGVARAIREIAATGTASLPVADGPGWWRCEDRFTVPQWSGVGLHVEARPADSFGKSSRPVLIAGAAGTLGSAFARIAALRQISACALSRDELDITNQDAVRDALDSLNPWAIINTAGYVRVDDAEYDSVACHRANAIGPAVLASECARRGIPLVTFSTDLVFDGQKAAPYIESDRPAPLNVYGASKLAGERYALDAGDNTLVIRTSAFFGPWDEHNFLSIALRTLASGLPFEAASDAVVSPTYVPDLVNATLDLLIDGERGIWHLANQGEITWSDLAREVASRLDIPATMVRGVPSDSMGRPAKQPPYSALGSERGALLPSLDSALNRWFSEASLPELKAVTA